jgi:hypothetical protein
MKGLDTILPGRWHRIGDVIDIKGTSKERLSPIFPWYNYYRNHEEVSVMKRIMGKAKKITARKDTLTEAYEVRAFRDETEEKLTASPPVPEIAHAEPGSFQKIKTAIKGHGEQVVLPDDCQYGDNDLCYVDA